MLVGNFVGGIKLLNPTIDEVPHIIFVQFFISRSDCDKGSIEWIAIEVIRINESANRPSITAKDILNEKFERHAN